MTEEITKEKVKINGEDSVYEVDEDLNLYDKDVGVGFHVSDLYSSDSSEKLFREEGYDHMADGDNLYRLTYDNGSLKIPNSNIEILNDEELPELKNYNSGFFSSKLFYINEDFDTIYVREDMNFNSILLYLTTEDEYEPETVLRNFNSILLYLTISLGFGLGFGQLIDFMNVESSIILGTLLIVGTIIVLFITEYLLEKTKNLDLIYNLEEYDVSHIDKLNN